MKSTLKTALVIAALLLVSAPAQADSFNFTCITNNSATDCGIGAAQLSVNVTAGPGAGQVQFQFLNNGSGASSITDVYFQVGGFVTSPLTITSSVGVSFSVVASPGNLPGGNPIGFTTTSQLTADSNPPVQPNGVNPGEWLTIVANLNGTQTFADLIQAMNNGTVVVGIHVQGFASGGSESMVNRPPTNVAEPGSLALLASGLLGLVGFVRRRNA